MKALAKCFAFGAGAGVAIIGLCLLIGSHYCGDFNINLEGEF